MNKFTPIVLGADTLGYSYAREFYKHYGIKCILLSSARVSYNFLSDFTDYRIVEGIDQEEVLIGWLKDNKDSFGDSTPIVFCGTGDWRVRTLSKHKPELEAMGYVIPAIDFDLLDSISRKDIFYALCDKLDMPFPRTWVYGFNEYHLDHSTDRMSVISTEEEVRALEYPLIAKPSNTAAWNGIEIPDQHKVYIIENADQLMEVINALEKTTYPCALLIQEMLSDTDESLHSITTFSDKDGNMIFGVTGDVLLQSHSATGIGNPLVILGRGSDPELLECARRFLKETKYEGYANFDVMDDAEGNHRFLEVNTRPGRNTYYVSLAGCPFVKPFIEYYINHSDLNESLSAEELAAKNEFLFTMVTEDIVKEWAHGDNLTDAMKHFENGTAKSPIICTEDNEEQQAAAIRYMNWLQSNTI